MGYAHPISNSWKVIEHRILIPLSGECKELVAKANDGSPVANRIVFTSLDQLRDMTACDLFPAGLDFRCNSDESIRALLYGDTRVYIADEFGLWYKAAPFRGTGIWWTADGLMGEIWFEVSKLEMRATELTRSLQLITLALKSTRPKHRHFLKEQRKAARGELTTVKVRIHNIEKFIIDGGFTDLLLSGGPSGK